MHPHAHLFFCRYWRIRSANCRFVSRFGLLAFWANGLIWIGSPLMPATSIAGGAVPNHSSCFATYAPGIHTHTPPAIGVGSGLPRSGSPILAKTLSGLIRP